VTKKLSVSLCVFRARRFKTERITFRYADKRYFHQIRQNSAEAMFGIKFVHFTKTTPEKPHNAIVRLA
jgi:hypothetical protein